MRSPKASCTPTSIRILATGLMHAMITGLLSDWLFTPGCIDLEGKAEQVVQACFDMLKTSPVLRKNPLAENPLTHSTKNRVSDDHCGRS